MVSIGQFSTPEEAAEYGLVRSTRDQTLSMVQKTFTEWEPGWQALPINVAAPLSGIAAGVTGMLTVWKLRRLLPGMSRVKLKSLPMPLTILVPSALSNMFHERYITNDILLQETPCPVCVETRAISGQVAIGVGMTYASACFGTLIISNYLNLSWNPRNIWDAFKFSKDLVIKGSNFFVVMTVIQMIIAGCLVSIQRLSYDTVMEELQNRINAANDVIDERLLNLDRD